MHKNCTICNGEGAVGDSSLNKCVSCLGTGINNYSVIDCMPNIYTILDRIDFDFKIKKGVNFIKSDFKMDFTDDELNNSLRQFVFKLIQEFNEELYKDIEEWEKVY